MAQGSVTTFDKFRKHIGDGSFDLDTDTFKIALLTTAPSVSDATPDYSTYSANEVTGGTSYIAGGATATVTWTEATGTATFALGADVTWSQDASGPTNIKYALVYDTTIASGNNAVCFIDMTADGGTTAISLADGDITIQQGTIFTLA